MDATPIDWNEARRNPALARAPGLAAMAERAPSSALSMKWSALHDAAGAAAGIAGIVPPPLSAQASAFPWVVRACSAGRRALAERGVDDLIAVLEPGLAGLLAAHARGARLDAAALALWTEFVVARDALIALVAPEAA